MNEKQIKAVKNQNDTLVIAGAGTGKTFTIVNKINYLIENNLYKEEEILVISFTNESVNDLKKRIKYKPDICTFHKLSLNIINEQDMKVCPNDYLSFIINEYFNSYAISNKNIKKALNRLKLEINQNDLNNLITRFINLYKANYYDINYLYSLYSKSHFIIKDYLRIILQIYQIYTNELIGSNYYDFNDMISYASYLIKENKRKTTYKYIIIDEFQDTSILRFDLIKNIKNQNDSKLFVVGDDYQSIYRFSGCDLRLILSLKQQIPNLDIISLDINYRNQTSLIKVANDFVMKNKNQIKKEMVCLKDIKKPIKIVFSKNQKKAISEIIQRINNNILILGRNNKDINDYDIKLNDNIKYLTIHKSKGLEADNVILINLFNNPHSLPSQICDHKIIKLLTPFEEYSYAEERRLFYVALTRTKNNIYLLTNENYSIFIKELIKNYKEYIEIIKI